MRGDVGRVGALAFALAGGALVAAAALGVARAGASMAMVSVAAADGARLPVNAPIVLRATAGCPTLKVEARDGEERLGGDLLRWPEAGAHRPGWYFLLRPKADEWPAGTTLDLDVSCHPDRLRVKIGTKKDTVAPVPAKFEAARREKGKTLETSALESLLLPFGTTKDAAAVVCMRVRLADPVRRLSIEVEGAFPSAGPSRFVLPPEHPSCLTGGVVVDPAGNVAVIPGAKCAKALPPEMRRPVGPACGSPAYVDTEVLEGLEL